MHFDLNNKVIKLCAEGMSAELEGRIEAAQALFDEAWSLAENDFERFTAAHYVARNQKEPADVLKWHVKALKHAELVKDDGMKAQFPSLFLNVAKSYESMGGTVEANSYYKRAAAACEFLPAGSYGDMIRYGVNEGLKRTSPEKEDDILLVLIDAWCERKELKALAIVLPAYLGNTGTSNDINKLTSALSYLVATRSLSRDEQQIAEGWIRERAVITNN